MNFFVTIYTLDDGCRFRPNRYHRHPSDLSLRLKGTATKGEQRLPSKQQHNQDDQKNRAKPTTDIRAADVEATATKQKHQDDNQDYQVHVVLHRQRLGRLAIFVWQSPLEDGQE
jgi:hypothetical protein